MSATRVPRRPRRVVLTVVCALGLAAACAAPASATVTMPLTFQQVVSFGPGRTPAIATNEAGHATMVFTRLDGNRDVAWSSLSPMGGWSSPRGFTRSRFGEDPEIAVSPNGHVIVAWERDHRIYAAIRRRGTMVFTDSKALGSMAAASDTNSSVSVDIGNNGQAVLAWEHHNSTNNRASVEAALVRTGTTFGPIRRIDGGTADTQQSFAPAVTIDGSGNAVIIYEDENGASDDDVRQALAPAGSTTWTSSLVDDSSQSANSVTHHLTIDSTQAGQLIAAWSSVCPDPEVCLDWPFAVSFTGTSAGGLVPATKQRLSNPASENAMLPTQPALVGEGFHPQARIDAGGLGTVMWEAEPDTAPDRLFGAFNSGGGALGASVEATTGISDEFALEHRVAAAGGGVLLAFADRRGAATSSRIYLGQRTHPTLGASSWKVAALGGTGQAADSPEVALGGAGAGTGTVVWRDSVNARILLRTSRLDRTAPQMPLPAAGSRLSVPASGPIRYPLTCPWGETRCIGTVVLRLTGSPTSALLGTARFTLMGGVTRSVPFTLTARGRSIFAAPILPVRIAARIAARDAAGNRRTHFRTHRPGRIIQLEP